MMKAKIVMPAHFKRICAKISSASEIFDSAQRIGVLYTANDYVEIMQNDKQMGNRQKLVFNR
jgi:hypothetical protein